MSAVYEKAFYKLVCAVLSDCPECYQEKLSELGRHGLARWLLKELSYVITDLRDEGEITEIQYESFYELEEETKFILALDAIDDVLDGIP